MLEEPRPIVEGEVEEHMEEGDEQHEHANMSYGTCERESAETYNH